jgi:type III secretion inner rod protein HrpB2
MNPSSVREASQTLFEKEFGGQTQMPQSTQALAERFEQLMAHAAPRAHIDSSAHETIVGKAIAAQESQWQTVPNDVLYLMQHPQSLPQESPIEAMDRHASEAIYVIQEMAQMNADMNIKLALVKSTKGSVETLMKNQ